MKAITFLGSLHPAFNSSSRTISSLILDFPSFFIPIQVQRRFVFSLTLILRLLVLRPVMFTEVAASFGLMGLGRPLPNHPPAGIDWRQPRIEASICGELAGARPPLQPSTHVAAFPLLDLDLSFAFRLLISWWSSCESPAVILYDDKLPGLTWRTRHPFIFLFSYLSNNSTKTSLNV